jgi:hypothetical protein
MWAFLDWVVAAIVWTLASVIYVDMRRKAVGGFGQFVAFWVGFPFTLPWLFVVEEGSGIELDPPADDEEQLLREVMLDRESRKLAPNGEGEGTGGTD